MLNIAVPEVALQRARINAVISKFEAARVPQHMRVYLDVQLNSLIPLLGVFAP